MRYNMPVRIRGILAQTPEFRAYRRLLGVKTEYLARVGGIWAHSCSHVPPLYKGLLNIIDEIILLPLQPRLTSGVCALLMDSYLELLYCHALIAYCTYKRRCLRGLVATYYYICNSHKKVSGVSYL